MSTWNRRQPAVTRLDGLGALNRGPSGRLASNRHQAPGAPFGLVDKVLQEACAGDVSLLVAKSVRLAQARGQLLVVVPQLDQHVQRRDDNSAFTGCTSS